jgi:hypothetical protein
VSTPEYTAPSALGLRTAATYSFAWLGPNGLTWEETVPCHTRLVPTGGACEAVLLVDGVGLVALVDGVGLVALVDGVGLVAFCANARCENCVPTIVNDVRRIAEIAIADSVVTVAYVFLCIRAQRLGMKFICFRPIFRKFIGCILL